MRGCNTYRPSLSNPLLLTNPGYILLYCDRWTQYWSSNFPALTNISMNRHDTTLTYPVPTWMSWRWPGRGCTTSLAILISIVPLHKPKFWCRPTWEHGIKVSKCLPLNLMWWTRLATYFFWFFLSSLKTVPLISCLISNVIRVWNLETDLMKVSVLYYI